MGIRKLSALRLPLTLEVLGLLLKTYCGLYMRNCGFKFPYGKSTSWIMKSGPNLGQRLRGDAKPKRSLAVARVGLIVGAAGTGSKFYRDFRPTALYYFLRRYFRLHYARRDLCESTDFP